MKHQISLTDAVAMTTAYRSQRAASMPLCETFERQSVDALLATTGCSYLRVYFGARADGSVHLVLVAADGDGRDILPEAGASYNASNPLILEDGYRCPPECPPPSKLNGGQ